MRFRANGPTMPGELVALQENGDTIFICGAAVSQMAGLPCFRGLVERVYKDLAEEAARTVSSEPDRPLRRKATSTARGARNPPRRKHVLGGI